MKILLLEDDFVLSKLIVDFFNQKNFNCDPYYDGSLLIQKYKSEKYDLIVLDINVPGKNGIAVCKAIREQDKKTPIIMLTAFSEIEDKLASFENGADDYLIKPFHFDELFARVNSLLRRKEVPQTEQKLKLIDDLEINISEMKVFRNKIEVKLTPKEYNLLLILANAEGKVVTKQIIADKLWDYHIETNQNTIEVYINFLRKKIDKDHKIKLIHTKIGYGYYLKIEE
ncbi:DNA-binding response regulator [Flavobacterium branchiophilum NBRC 15030 = ATCC 35035]|uniref:DNA-binding response OmpR family regulator n=1 Tax=Flavobacterium branchiophilum TaxID=55197 RepID=A0A543G873_9FLAO|nr:response regulator transcription factor [Flavobacterium branchiophilum]OXA81940.1 DNA-binding response regulator [Flavobacterium branchiophilum NBRC 15030 = ATCC 35035]TQM42281.1 DNA-binding response OmpR family regulator [Flavobacterium branchiophilum]GEM54708.1 DNA-binding response regulator [Flavobacterium branchiophilum NBRC 15030 = ATCC 35035]